MWINSENGENIRPKAIESTGNHVVIRKDFVLVEATDEIPAHYKYKEWQMTKEQYEVYNDFEERIREQDDALIELAELISEVL